MTGEWIKLRKDLFDNPKVIQMSELVGLDAWGVVGRLAALWSWVDGHSVDGRRLTVPRSWIDKRVECDGFADAMESVGWLEGSDGSLTFPEWEQHNASTGKARALETEAKRLRRLGEQNRETPESKPKGQPRKEQQRQEEAKKARPANDPKPKKKARPTGGETKITNDMRETIYQAYPRKEGKTQALMEIHKALQEVPADKLLEAVEEYAEAVSDQDKQFIPKPENWFADGRWNDDRSFWTAHREAAAAKSSTAGIEAGCARLEAMERGDVIDAEYSQHDPARITEEPDNGRF